MKISAILLAAGLSRRMGTDKLMLEYKEKTLLQHALDLMSALPVFERIIITTDNRINKISLPYDIKQIVNRSPDCGQSLSIKLGIGSATGTHYLFMVADQPKLTVSDITALITSGKPDSIVYPQVNGVPCSPTLFPKAYQTDLLRLEGDMGGRVVRDANPLSCHIIIPENPDNFIDVDIIDEYLEVVD